MRSIRILVASLCIFIVRLTNTITYFFTFSSAKTKIQIVFSSLRRSRSKLFNPTSRFDTVDEQIGKLKSMCAMMNQGRIPVYKLVEDFHNKKSFPKTMFGNTNLRCYSAFFSKRTFRSRVRWPPSSPIHFSAILRSIEGGDRNA